MPLLKVPNLKTEIIFNIGGQVWKIQGNLWHTQIFFS